MNHIGFIEAEGGPLILIDLALVQLWTGIDGGDYERACTYLDSRPNTIGGALAVEGHAAVIWDMRGAGRAEVYADGNDRLTLVRAWLARNADTSTLDALAEQPAGRLISLGEIEIKSAAVAILWATEKGLRLGGDPSHVQRPKSLNFDNAGLIVPLRIGKYEAKHDLIRNADSEAQRLHLKFKDK